MEWGFLRCCMRTPWDLWDQCRAGGRCFPGSAGLDVQEAVKPVTGWGSVVETCLCFAEAPEFLLGGSSRCQGPRGLWAEDGGSREGPNSNVGHRHCETQGNVKAPGLVSCKAPDRGSLGGVCYSEDTLHPPLQVV